MMRWRMGRRSLCALVLLFGLIAGYGPQPVEAQVTFTQITNTTGWVGNGWSSINADGTRMAFRSDRNLTPGGPGNADGNLEIFLWTQGAGFTQITNTTGGDNKEPSISADGTRTAFLSNADLIGGNSDRNTELFLWTQGVGIRQLTDSAGIATYECNLAPMVSINGDGTRIAFVSSLDLTPGNPGNPDGSCELFLWTDADGIRQLTNTDGIGGNISGVSISADGKTIALSLAAGLGSVTPPTNGSFDLFRWTDGGGISQLTTLTTGAVFVPSTNADGTRIAFLSSADLTPGAPGNADGNTELFLWTQEVGMRQLTATDGCCGMHLSVSINANGTRILFVTDHDLTGGNPDRNTEVFLWTQGAAPSIMQITNTTGSGNGSRSISADGARIAFDSSRDLTGDNPDGNWEIFLATISTGPPTVPPTPTGLSPGSTSSPGPTLGSSTVTVSWNASSGANLYVGGITDIATGSAVVTINTSDTSTAATLSPGKQYRWYVFACNSTGCSSSSALYYFQTPTSPDTVTITSGPSGTPSTVASGGTVSLSVSATDSQSHQLNYTWSALCSGLPSNGSFSNSNTQNPTWTAPTNTTGTAKSCAFTVTVNDGLGHSATQSFTETVNASTTNLPTASWTTLPPTSLTAGQKFEVAWTTTGTPTHVNVHWNQTDPLATDCCLGASDTTDSSTSSPTKSPATLTVPTKNADGTPIMSPMTLKYIVHVSNAAGSGNSAVVAVTLNPGPKVATPTFSPIPGTVTKSVKVKITAATKGATIRYTTDGSAPTATSPRYRKSLTVSQTTILKARAFKSGMADSDMAEGTYTFVIPQKIVLLLHGLNSNPDTWNSFAQAYFEGNCVTIYAGAVLATPHPNDKGTLCYRVKFGEYDQSGPEGLEDAKTRANGETKGDFSTFEQLGDEVAEAVSGLRGGYPNATIVLVGHSRGGLAARAFLQGSRHTEEKASVVGLITTGTPHLGTRLGRFYAYLENHPRGADEDTWQVVDLLQENHFDVRKPGVDYLSDKSDEIAKLSRLPSITKNIRYGQISYKAFDLGVLARASDWLEQAACDDDVYSIFDDWGTDCGDQVSGQSWAAILGEGKKPKAYEGDGTVPSDSQLGAAPSHAKKRTIDAPDILHTEEPEKVADVFWMFNKLGFKDWLR